MAEPVTLAVPCDGTTAALRRVGDSWVTERRRPYEMNDVRKRLRTRISRHLGAAGLIPNDITAGLRIGKPGTALRLDLTATPPALLVPIDRVPEVLDLDPPALAALLG